MSLTILFILCLQVGTSVGQTDLMLKMLPLAQTQPWEFKGTTPNIQTIFEGRCNEYQELNAHNKITGLTSDIDCKALWKAFSKAFAHKDPCKTQITEKDYNGFFSLLKQKDKLTDKAMFWSGIKELVHDLSNVNTDYVTMEDTLVGFIVNGLTWCGSTKTKDGIEFKECPQDNSCQSAIGAFWSYASRNFAKSAAGKAYLMVNSTLLPKRNAYWPGSFFGRIELPTLGKHKQVKNLNVYLVSNIGMTPKERCGKDSLKKLEVDAKIYGIGIKCVEDPGVVEALLCAKFPAASQCKKYSSKRSVAKE